MSQPNTLIEQLDTLRSQFIKEGFTDGGMEIFSADHVIIVIAWDAHEKTFFLNEYRLEPCGPDDQDWNEHKSIPLNDYSDDEQRAYVRHVEQLMEHLTDRQGIKEQKEWRKEVENLCKLAQSSSIKKAEMSLFIPALGDLERDKTITFTFDGKQIMRTSDDGVIKSHTHILLVGHKELIELRPYIIMFGEYLHCISGN